jgi:hypothetical protein
MFTFGVCLTHCCDFWCASDTLRNQIYISFTNNEMSNATKSTLMTNRQGKSFSDQSADTRCNESCMLRIYVLNFAYVISLVFF